MHCVKQAFFARLCLVIDVDKASGIEGVGGAAREQMLVSWQQLARVDPGKTDEASIQQRLQRHLSEPPAGAQHGQRAARWLKRADGTKACRGG